MKKAPEYLEIRFGDIHPWDKNPKDIKKKDLIVLAKKIEKFHLFRNFVCWKENGKITTGGGNMRWQACKKILKFEDDRKVMISMNYPENEQEKIELSLLDNMIFGMYLEQPLAELVYPHRHKIDLENIRVHFSNPIDMKTFVSGFGPDGVENINFVDQSDRHTISIVCKNDKEMIEMRKLLGITEKKSNAIDASVLKEILKK